MCAYVYINGLKLMLDNSKHPTGNTKVTIKEFSMNYGNLVVGINQLELISWRSCCTVSFEQSYQGFRSDRKSHPTAPVPGGVF